MARQVPSGTCHTRESSHRSDVAVLRPGRATPLERRGIPASGDEPLPGPGLRGRRALPVRGGGEACPGWRAGPAHQGGLDGLGGDDERVGLVGTGSRRRAPSAPTVRSPARVISESPVPSPMSRLPTAPRAPLRSGGRAEPVRPTRHAGHSRGRQRRRGETARAPARRRPDSAAGRGVVHADLPPVQAAPGSGVCSPWTYLSRNCRTRGSEAVSTPSCLPQADRVIGEVWPA